MTGSPVAKTDGANEVDEFTETLLVERGTGVVLGEHPLEGWIVPLDGLHGVVDDLTDGWLFGVGLKLRPAGVLGHPEDVLRPVFVRILRGRPPGPVGDQLEAKLLEGVRDVLEEDKPQDDMFVVRGI